MTNQPLYRPPATPRPSIDDIDALVAWHCAALGFGAEDEVRRRTQTEQSQQQRWGATGLAVLGITEDEEAARRDAEWSATSIVDEALALIEAL